MKAPRFKPQTKERHSQMPEFYRPKEVKKEKEYLTRFIYDCRVDDSISRTLEAIVGEFLPETEENLEIRTKWHMAITADGYFFANKLPEGIPDNWSNWYSAKTLIELGVIRPELRELMTALGKIRFTVTMPIYRGDIRPVIGKYIKNFKPYNYKSMNIVAKEKIIKSKYDLGHGVFLVRYEGGGFEIVDERRNG